MKGQPVVRSYAELAAAVLASDARLGPVRLVAVDGGAGSGKTTFAGRLAAALDAPLVHTDDLLDGWGDLVAFWPRLEEWVLAPLRAGQPGRYRRYDWDRAAFAEWHDVPVRPTVVVEGVTAARSTIRAELTLSVWMDAPADVRLERGIARDGERLRPQWLQWLTAEAAFVAQDGTLEHADVVVDGRPQVEHDPDTQFVQLHRHV